MSGLQYSDLIKLSYVASDSSNVVSCTLQSTPLYGTIIIAENITGTAVLVLTHESVFVFSN